MLRFSNKFLITLLLIPAILMVVWFRNGLIHGGGEEGIMFYNPQKTLQFSTSVWAEFTTGSFIVVWLQKLPLVYLATIFEKSGMPLFLFQAILFYTLMVIGMFSVYFLTLNLLKDNNQSFSANKSENLISLISAIFYLFNPFSFSQIWGRSLSTQYFAFSLFPLTLLLFHLGFKRKKYIFGLLIALVSSIMSVAFEFLTFIIVYWSILLVCFFYKILISKDRAKEVFFGIKFILLIAIFWSFLNSWWFIPLFLSFGNVNSAGLPNIEQNLGTLLGVSRSFTPDVVVRLLHKGYFFDSSAFSQIYSTLPFQLISFIPLYFVLVGLVKILKNQELVKFRFFVVLLVLGWVVSSGANPPFGWLFVWIFEHITPLQAFRNPFEKFGLVYALGYVPLFAYGLVMSFEGSKYKKAILILVLFLTCGIYAWPMWTGRVIAGYDKKIGLDIPTYYKELRDWLADRGGDYRLLMTPIWAGDSAFYQWNNAARYQGSDPMVFMLDQSVISNSARGPFYFDFITNIRKYMERINVVPSLSLLRTKFLVDRKDAIMITDREKDQYQVLTSAIYPPKGVDAELRVICQNEFADTQLNNIAWIKCQIPLGEGDLSDIKYLQVKVKTSEAANLEVAIRDNKETRIRWDGSRDLEYSTDTNDWHYITLPLSTVTEYNSAIDLSNVFMLEVLAHPKEKPLESVKEINLGEVKLDSGVRKEINEFKEVTKFGKLSIFEAVNFNPPPEFGTLLSTDLVQDFVSLFGVLNEKRDLIHEKGFILISQNTQKNLNLLPKNTTLQAMDKNKISNTRYWLKVNEASEGGLLMLSKTFDSQWKVIPNVKKEQLSGNFFDNLNLLKRVALPENHHFVVNGYGNLWKIDGEDREYAIIFRPQIIADISFKVSVLGVLVVIGFSVLWWGSKIASKKK